MVRIKFITGLVLLLPCIGFSQGEFNNWYFGKFKALDFSSGNPVLLPASAMNTGCVTSSVSDSNGNLLFYSGGYRVYNKNHQIMPNGSFMNGNTGSFAQSNLALKKIGDENRYFLFKSGMWQSSPFPWIPASYSIIDMSLDGGLGDILPAFKNIPVPGGNRALNFVTGTRHYNNRDAWVVFRIMDPDSNFFAAYQITSAGLNPIPVMSPSLKYFPPSNLFFFPGDGEIKISPDGTRLMSYYQDTLEVCDFNAQTGAVNPNYKIRVRYNGQPVMMTQMEFSIDSRQLYFSGTYGGTNTIFQADALIVDSARFNGSLLPIGLGVQSHSALQMGPDWKIYGTRDTWDSLWVINSPNVLGVGCNFQSNGAYLGWDSHADGLPQFVQRYKAYIHHNGYCQRNIVTFSGDVWPPADSIRWDFGDPVTGSNNQSIQANPGHTYADAGTYLVTLYVRHIDQRTDTSRLWVTMEPSPLPQLGPDKTICTGDSTTIDAGFCTGCLYNWDNLSTGQTNIGNLQTYTVQQSGIYMVSVTGMNGCIGRDTVEIFTTTNPMITTVPLWDTICSGATSAIPLASNVPNALFYWTAELTQGNVTGFAADSGLMISQVLENHEATPGIVTYKIHAGVGNCIGDTLEFPVTVIPADPIMVSISSDATTVCAGTPVAFTATGTNVGLMPAYQWKVNAVNVVNATDAVFTYSPANGDTIQCVLTSSNTLCTSNNPATSNAITMAVNPIQPVSVSVSYSANPVCAGTSVNFTALPVNGGTTPHYQWKVNGLITGASSPAYSYVPTNGDTITCNVTSNVQCPSGNPAISNKLTMTVNPILPVSVSILTSSNPFCSGNPVTFTATPVNGGSNPFYQWKVNGNNSGTNNPAFTCSPANGDLVSCWLTSSEMCESGNPAQSNPISMVVNTNLPAGITILASANPFCPGAAVTFTATPSNGGTTPMYQWKVNSILSIPSILPIHTYNPANHDTVSCILTSNLNCVTANPASSAKIIMIGSLAPNVSFSACFDTVTTANAKPFKLRGGLPLGGSYSGPGVNSSTGMFTPSVAGIGVKTINYSYSNVHDCVAGKSKSIVVQPNPSFSCGSNFVDIRDNQVYPTVQIGTQCWMASNLDFGYSTLDLVPQTDNCISEKYVRTSSFVIRTSFYQWDELMRYSPAPASQGLCPPGWHVPTESEWNILSDYYGGSSKAGRPLQDSIANGFAATRSGVFYSGASWNFMDFATIFWTSTPSGQDKAISRGMNAVNYSVSLYPAGRGTAFGARCIHD